MRTAARVWRSTQMIRIWNPGIDRVMFHHRARLSALAVSRRPAKPRLERVATCAKAGDNSHGDQPAPRA